MIENYMSAFKVRVKFTVGGGDVTIPSHDFTLRFRTTANGHFFDCWKKGTTYNNMEEDSTDDTKIICSIPGGVLPVGDLRVEFFDFIPDSSFDDGTMLKVVPCPMGTTLVVGEGDGNDIDAEVALELVSQLGDFQSEIDAMDERLDVLEADMEGVLSLTENEYDPIAYTEIKRSRITVLKRISDVSGSSYNDYSVIHVPVTAGKEYRITFVGDPDEVDDITGTYAALWYSTTPVKSDSVYGTTWALLSGDDPMTASAVMTGETGGSEVTKTYSVTAPSGATHLAVALVHGVLDTVISEKRFVIKEDSLPGVTSLVDEVGSIRKTVNEMITLESNTPMTAVGSKSYRISGAGKFLSAGSGVGLSYYAVTEGDTIMVHFSGDNPASLESYYNLAGLAWSESVPALNGLCELVKDGGAFVPLSKIDGHTFSLVAPYDGYLSVATHADLQPITVVKKLAALSPATFSTLPGRVDSLEEEVFTNSITEEKYVEIDSDQRGKYHVKPSSLTYAANANGSMLFRLQVASVTGGKTYKITWSGDNDVVSAIDNGASVSTGVWFASSPSSGSTGISHAITSGGSGVIIKDILTGGTTVGGVTTKSYEVVAPSNATHLACSWYEGYLSATVEELNRFVKEDAIPKDSGNAKQDFEWNIPSKIYAIYEVEKRIYLNNISNSFGEVLIDLSGDSTPTSAVLGYRNAVDNANDDRMIVTGDYISFTPHDTGTATFTLAAFNLMGVKLSEKTITVEVLAQTLPLSSKRVCLIGDSITRNRNMAYFTEGGFKDIFGSSATGLPTFVGTYNKVYSGTTTPERTTRNEGHYGHNYHWLISNSDSPFVNNGSLDIAHWRSVLGLGDNKADVVSLAMGFNSTDNVDGEFGHMMTLINAFVDDNPNTIFVVQLCPLTSSGPGIRNRVVKNKKLLEFRKLCMERITNPNVIVGDLGCCYDRYYAYRHVLDHPAPYYTTIGVVGGSATNHLIETLDTSNQGGYNDRGDTTHPSDAGTQQMGESIVPVLLKAMMTEAVVPEDSEDENEDE